MPPVRKPKPSTAPAPPAASTTPERSSEPAVYVASTSFACTLDGENVSVRKDKTRVVEGDPLLAAYPDYFKRADEGTVSRLGVDLTR